MQWLSKNTVIVVLSASLASLLFIKNETQLGDANVDGEKGVGNQIRITPLKLDSKQRVTTTSNQYSNWNDRQIIDYLNGKDTLSLLQTLSYIWIHIDSYSKHDEIMRLVQVLTKRSDDHRISDLASLLSGQLVPRESLTKHTIRSNDDWSDPEQQILVRQDDQSESDFENQDFSSFDSIKRDSVNFEERIQYIDQLLSHRDGSNVNEFAALILDTDEAVSIAAVDALIMSLKQGIGDADEIQALLEENMAFLDELQVQTFEEILASTHR